MKGQITVLLLGISKVLQSLLENVYEHSAQVLIYVNFILFIWLSFCRQNISKSTSDKRMVNCKALVTSWPMSVCRGKNPANQRKYKLLVCHTYSDWLDVPVVFIVVYIVATPESFKAFSCFKAFFN